MDGCLLLLVTFLAMHDITYGCRSREDYTVNCVNRFNEIEQFSDDFWGDMCSTEGRTLWDCLNQQIRGADCVSYDAVVEQKFNAIFGSFEFNMDITCEVKTRSSWTDKGRDVTLRGGCCVASAVVWFPSYYSILVRQATSDNGGVHDPSCRTILDCVDVFTKTKVPATPAVYNFWQFTCGPNYLNQLFTCITALEPVCPLTAEKQTNLIQIYTSQGFMTYAQVKAITSKSCQKLTGANIECINSQSTQLDTCGTTPAIDISISQIVCNYTDKTRGCLNDVCGATVADFYLETFQFLKCGFTLTACPPEERDLRFWPVTAVGNTATLPCPSDCYTGSLSRYCSPATSWGTAESTCRYRVECIPDIVINMDDLPVYIEELVNITNNDPIISLNPEVVDTIADRVEKIVDTMENNIGNDVVINSYEPFLDLVNNLLSPENTETWKETSNQTGTSIEDLMVELDDYLEVLLRNEEIINKIPINSISPQQRKQILVTIGRTANDITFPQQAASTAYIEVDKQSLKKLSSGGFALYAGNYFTTLDVILEPSAVINSSITKSLTLNSDVIGLTVLGQTSGFDPPIKLTFKMKKDKYASPTCVFWDKSITTDGLKGAWSPEGCSLVSYTNMTVKCACNHLTNFAVLMSPSPDSLDSEILNIISAVGCGISIICLLITIIVHFIVWRLVRSDRAVILMNICIALLFALAIFLVGINRIESRSVCAAMAALIQFFFLAVFFLMLVMGIEMICIIHVGTKFRIKILVPLAWAIAGIVVGISLAVTKTEGYGNDRFCWLDVSSGLIWAFIGPVLLVILCNFIIIFIVLSKLATLRVVKSKSKKLQLKTAARSLCVLMPLLGLTWVFGVLSINEDLVWMAYVFCILNSLQGLFIFIMHCAFNRQIRDALKHRERRKRSLQSFSTDRKKSRSTALNQNDSESTPERQVRPGRRGAVNESFSDDDQFNARRWKKNDSRI